MNSLKTQSLSAIFQSSLGLKREERIPFSVFLADHNMYNEKIDDTSWQESIPLQMTELFGGCSVTPNIQGFWLQGTTLIQERTIIATSFVSMDKFMENIVVLKPVLDQYYFDTLQDTLLLMLGNEVFFYRPTGSVLPQEDESLL